MPSIFEQARSVQGNVWRAGCSGPARARGSVSQLVASYKRIMTFKGLWEIKRVKKRAQVTYHAAFKLRKFLCGHTPSSLRLKFTKEHL